MTSSHQGDPPVPQPETVYHRLGLEPTWFDSNPAKTQFGTRTHMTGTQTQPKLCLGLQPEGENRQSWTPS